jgi:hypothetical protein
MKPYVLIEGRRGRPRGARAITRAGQLVKHDGGPLMPHKITVQHSFESGHRLPHLGGKYVSLHGRSWSVG